MATCRPHTICTECWTSYQVHIFRPTKARKSRLLHNGHITSKTITVSFILNVEYAVLNLVFPTISCNSFDYMYLPTLAHANHKTRLNHAYQYILARLQHLYFIAFASTPQSLISVTRNSYTMQTSCPFYGAFPSCIQQSDKCRIVLIISVTAIWSSVCPIYAQRSPMRVRVPSGGNHFVRRVISDNNIATLPTGIFDDMSSLTRLWVLLAAIVWTIRMPYTSSYWHTFDCFWLIDSPRYRRPESSRLSCREDTVSDDCMFETARYKTDETMLRQSCHSRTTAFSRNRAHSMQCGINPRKSPSSGYQ